MRRQALLFLWLILLSTYGCYGMKVSAPPAATLFGAPDHFRTGQIVDLDSGKALSFEELIRRIASKDLVFIGEVHDNPDHHLIQVQILQALLETSVRFTIGMEFFQVKQQATLDRYLQRELNEEEFLKEADWQGNWGFDYHLYRPLLLLARQHGIRVIALNAPPGIVRKVAREGLRALDGEESSQIAQEIDLKNEAHRNQVKAVYERHPKEVLKSFDHFFEAQAVWDETMAEKLAEHLRLTGDKVIVFSGNGHIDHKFGIPDRTLRRHPASAATIMLLPLGRDTVLEKGMADYIWLTAEFFHRSMRPQ